MPYKDPQRAKEHSRLYYLLHKEKIREQAKVYAKTHREEGRKWELKYRETHREEIRDRGRLWNKTYPERRAKASRKWNQKLRLEVLVVYGGNPPKCACCGEGHIEFLSFDHIGGGGNKHRKEIGLGYRMYSWLKNHNYPTGYRVLCYNCNLSLGFNGYCPHQIVDDKYFPGNKDLTSCTK